MSLYWTASNFPNYIYTPCSENSAPPPSYSYSTRHTPCLHWTMYYHLSSTQQNYKQGTENLVKKQSSKSANFRCFWWKFNTGRFVSFWVWVWFSLSNSPGSLLRSTITSVATQPSRRVRLRRMFCSSPSNLFPQIGKVF